VGGHVDVAVQRRPLSPPDLAHDDEFARLVERLDYPMFVVTAAAGADHAGCLVGFVTQTGIDPPRVLVCISRTNATAEVARRATHLVVHVLRRHDTDIASHFGEVTGREVDKFASVRWREGPGGAPVLDGLDWFAGPILDRIESLGDHTGYLLATGSSGHAVAEHVAVDQLGYQQVRDLHAANPP